MAARLEKWEASPGLRTAAEFVEAALVQKREKEPRAIEAARRLLEPASNAAPMIKSQAAVVMRRAGLGAEDPGLPKQHRETTVGAELRRMTRINPSDALAWVELALHQTVRHSPSAAERSMLVALQLAPDDRHVLRSASRLWLHLGRPDRAHDVLLSSDATKSDPWLMAAEIAIARLAARSPRSFKRGLHLLDGGVFADRQITELAGALATVELLDGSARKSRRMFSRSMADPTGNSLAQGEWASVQLGAELVPAERHRDTPEPFEADAFKLYRAWQFSAVPALCRQWAEVDPYSIRPFEFGAAAASHAEMFEEVEQMARLGLERRPGSPLLMNSLAFALSSLDRAAEAEAVLARMPKHCDEHSIALATANKGQCALRLGRVEEGISLYRGAIARFLQLGKHSLVASAKVFLAKEAYVAQLDEASAYLDDAIAAMKPFMSTEPAVLLVRLKNARAELSLSREERETVERRRRLERLRSVTFSTPGLPILRRRLIVSDDR